MLAAGVHIWATHVDFENDVIFPGDSNDSARKMQKFFSTVCRDVHYQRFFCIACDFAHTWQVPLEVCKPIVWKAERIDSGSVIGDIEICAARVSFATSLGERTDEDMRKVRNLRQLLNVPNRFRPPSRVHQPKITTNHDTPPFQLVGSANEHTLRSEKRQEIVGK